jgi:hypothetical protein
MQLPRADCVMKIDFRTLRIAGLVCGFSAAIAPIDSAWSQCITVQEVSKGDGVGWLVNGQPATAAQVKQCQQCRTSSSGSCAQFKASADALIAQRSEEKNCAGGQSSAACAKARKAENDAKNKEAEQKQQALGKKNNSTSNTGNSVQVQSLTPIGKNTPPKPNK